MIKILLVFIGLIVVYVFATCRYKRQVLKGLDKKEYSLHFMLGSGLFLWDRIPAKISGAYMRRLSAKYRQLYGSNGLKRRCYLYIGQKICECIVCLLCVLVFCSVYILKNDFSGEVKSIERPAENEEDEKHELLMNGEKVKVTIPKKVYSEDEALKRFDDLYEYCIDNMLSKNTSLDSIKENINLETMYFEDGVKANWEVDDKHIDADGSIDNLNLEENISSKLILIMEYGDYKKEYDVNIKIIKRDESAQDIIQDYIDSQDRANDFVNLPESIDEEKVSFYNQKNNAWLIILAFGVMLSLSLFALRDFDIKDKLRYRHEQMVTDYPEILNKYALLCRAGMSSIKALERMVVDYEKTGDYRYAYEELKMLVKKIRLGDGEAYAYEEFGRKCNDAGYAKFAALLSENIKRGASNFEERLNDEIINAWKEKENILKERGERVGTNLIFPMIMLLVITLIMIVFPACMSMKGVV